MLLCAHRLIQPAQQVVDRADQGCHLLRHIALGDRAEVIGFAAAYSLLQLVERLDASGQCKPHQQHRQRQHDELRHDHTLDDLGGQARALVQRLGHLHQRRCLARFPGARQPQVGHPHRVGVDLVVAVFQDLRWTGRLVGHRQAALAGNEFTARAQHLEIHFFGIVGAQRFGHHLGQTQPDHRGLVGATGCDHDLTRHRARQFGQVAVERPARNVLCHQPGQRHAHRPQQQQRREHPVENLAEQGALLFRSRFGLVGQRHGEPEHRAWHPPGLEIRRGFSRGSNPDHAPWRCESALARSSCASGGCRPRSRCC